MAHSIAAVREHSRVVFLFLKSTKSFERADPRAGGKGGLQSSPPVAGLPESCFDELTFRDVRFGVLVNSTAWRCSNVQQSSFVHEQVDPPFTGCKNAANSTCAPQVRL